MGTPRRFFEHIFHIEAIAKGRPRFSTRGGFTRSYTPAKTRDFEGTISQMARAAVGRHFQPLEGALSAEITFYLPRPKSAKKRLYPSVRPDTDNFLKAILDGISQIVFVDDGQIVDIIAQKRYAPGEPFIRVKIAEMGETS